MSDRDRLLRAIVGPRGPRDPAAARVWHGLPQDEQARLRWAATDAAAASHLHTDVHRMLVDQLAADHSVRRPWDVVAPVVVGLLVLSTVWGFGRAVVPEAAGWFLLLGLAGAGIATIAGLRRRAAQRAAARLVRHAVRGRWQPDD